MGKPMLYIILIGVIIFLIFKVFKTKNIAINNTKSNENIQEKRYERTVNREKSKSIEPRIATDKISEDFNQNINSKVSLIIDESSDNDEEITEEEIKKPLSEIIKRRIHHRKVLTLNEQPMFHRLKEALPEYSVLPQVSFNSLIWSKSKYIRNRFNRKVCDFAICDEVFKPIFVIELDDPSHIGKEQEDADRDCILNEAKIRVIRYKKVPEIEVIRRDVGLI